MPVTILQEWVSIGTWVFGTRASHIIKVEPLYSGARWVFPADGPPAADGLPARRGRPRARYIALNAMVFGDYDSDGVAIADYRAGLASNLGAMEAAITPPSTPPYTRNLVHHIAAGNERTAAVQAQIFDVQNFSPRSVVVTLDITIPSGVWT